jgi:hypothetical protein
VALANCASKVALGSCAPIIGVISGIDTTTFNRVFELAGVLYQPHPEPIVLKRKIVVPPPQKTGQKWTRASGSSCSGDQAPTKELALATALKPSKKFIPGSSRRSLTEKASATKDGIHVGKKSLPHTVAKAWDLFGYASNGEAAAPTPMPVPCRKRPRKSLPKASRKSSDAAPMKGTSIWRRPIHLFYIRYI